MWECPKCHESMHDYDDNCWSCGSKNPSLSEKSDAAARMKKCPYCAEEIRYEALKCRFCGSLMPEPAVARGAHAPAAVSPAEKTDDEIRISKKVVIIVILISCLAAAAVTAFVFRGPLSAMIGPKEKNPATIDVEGGIERKVAYEEVIEYDGRGNVKKSTKSYQPSQAEKK